MKTVEIADATSPLADYVAGVRTEPLVITRIGPPRSWSAHLQEGLAYSRPPSGQLRQCVLGGREGRYSFTSPVAKTRASCRNVSEALGRSPSARFG